MDFALEAEMSGTRGLTDSDREFRCRLGHRLRLVRLALGLGVRELSKRVGVSSSTLTSYELGRTTMSVVMLMRLCRELGFLPAQLLPYMEVEGKGESDRDSAGLALSAENRSSARVVG